MVNLGVYPEDDTVRIMFSTAAADGGEENFSATLEEADIVVRKDGSNMTLDASTITINAVATGIYEVVIDLSNDADFTAGSEYWVYADPNDETIDSQNVSAILAVFWIETALEKSLGLMSAIHTNYTVGATGNDTTHVHLDGIDAGVGDNEINGELLLLYDVSESEFHYAVVTDFVNTGDLATVQNIYDGGVLPFTPASGDYWWRVGVAPLVPTVKGRTLGVDTSGNASANVTQVSGGTTAADNLEAAFDGTGYDLGGLDVSELNAIVDDLINGGRLDLLIDAIKAKTDALTFSAAGFVDANVMEVNDNGGLTGDGDATPIGKA